ncbi:uncharacterized protein METZ01_LOCUS386459 [marine metagenome]|uniref:DUF6249 domain-containing protein n=1 Tax=marine metagenome TaxID=408172 RepID=A0A382UIE3_9ZZZZ
MVSLRYISWRDICHAYTQGVIMESTLALGIPYVAILMPVLLLGVIFFFDNKSKKEKYAAIVEISKNIQDPSEIKDLVEDLQERKKPIDYRRGGVISLFVGLGLFLFGTVSSIGILKGAGLLVATIGVGSIVAGYVYPNESAEITKAVEDFEKK